MKIPDIFACIANLSENDSPSSEILNYTLLRNPLSYPENRTQDFTIVLRKSYPEIHYRTQKIVPRNPLSDPEHRTQKSTIWPRIILPRIHYRTQKIVPRFQVQYGWHCWNEVQFCATQCTHQLFHASVVRFNRENTFCKVFWLSFKLSLGYSW